jgi:hypothetical protein
MKEPGLYSARIVARRASTRGAAAPEEIEFELANTVIIPYTFSPESSYTVTTGQQKLDAGLLRRFYFAPPKGAAALTFTLGVQKGSRSNVSGWIIDRNGYNVNYLPRAKGTERSEGSNRVSTNDLGDGVIEVVVQADAFEGTGQPSEFTLSVSCTMLDIEPRVQRDGDGHSLTVDAVNVGDRIVTGSFTYTMKGYGRAVRDTMRGDTFSMPLVMRKGDGALWISPRFSRETYNRATDILARIVDAEGNVQGQETYNQPAEWLFIPNFDRSADSTVYHLQIIFGSANYDKIAPIPIEIIEHHVHPSDAHQLDGYVGTELVPYIPESLTTKLPAETIPTGYYGLGDLTFKPRGEDQGITWEFKVE